MGRNEKLGEMLSLLSVLVYEGRRPLATKRATANIFAGKKSATFLRKPEADKH